MTAAGVGVPSPRGQSAHSDGVGVAPASKPFDGLSRPARRGERGDKRSSVETRETRETRKDSPDSLDRTSIRSSKSTSGRHRRHPALSQSTQSPQSTQSQSHLRAHQQTFSKRQPSFPSALSTSSPSPNPAAGPRLPDLAVSKGPSAGPSRPSRYGLISASASWPTRSSSNVIEAIEHNIAGPSLLISPRQRCRSLSKHALSPESTSLKSSHSHSRSHSLNPPPSSSSSSPDDIASPPSSDIVLPPISRNTPGAPKSDKPSSLRSLAPSLLTDYLKDEKFLPLPAAPPSPSPTPAPSRIRSFRSRLPLPISRSLTRLSETVVSADNVETSADPKPAFPNMYSGAREAALGTALREGSDPMPTLEEYAWRSLIARVRVRDYCENATFAVCAVSNLIADHMDERGLWWPTVPSPATPRSTQTSLHLLPSASL